MARLKKGLTQDALARRVGCKKQTVSSIETGRHNPSARLYPAFAEVLGIPLEPLISFYEGIEITSEQPDSAHG